MTDFAIIQCAPRHRQRNGRGGAPSACILLVSAACLLGPPHSSASRLVVTNGEYTPIRVGPSKVHRRLTELPAGVPLWAEDKVGGWYRLRLAETLTAYAHEVSVNALAPGEPPAPGRLSGVTVAPSATGVRVTLTLSRPLPYRVRQTVEPQGLCLDLFGAETADCRWSCLPVEGFLGGMRLSQPEPDRVRLRVDLATVQQRGYGVLYPDGRDLVLEIHRPHADPGLRGKLVVLDPGHGGDDEGAVGPTGLQEKDANLAIARHVRDLLVRKGCTVLLTRDGDLPVAPPGSTTRTELTARVVLAKSHRPDVFVGIHCNHPGGGNRRDVAGTETYYWSPMSARPAELIQHALCREAGTLSRRVAPASFRVLRETDAPRVLVECCYISCPAEEAMLREPAGRRRIATGIVDGLTQYFRAAAPRRGLRRVHGE